MGIRGTLTISRDGEGCLSCWVSMQRYMLCSKGKRELQPIEEKLADLAMKKMNGWKLAVRDVRESFRRRIKLPIWLMMASWASLWSHTGFLSCRIFRSSHQFFHFLLQGARFHSSSPCLRFLFLIVPLRWLYNPDPRNFYRWISTWSRTHAPLIGFLGALIPYI